MQMKRASLVHVEMSNTWVGFQKSFAYLMLSKISRQNWEVSNVLRSFRQSFLYYLQPLTWVKSHSFEVVGASEIVFNGKNIPNMGVLIL